jgi:hypothetical protein
MRDFDFSQVPGSSFTADRTPLKLTAEQREQFISVINEGFGRTLSGETPISVVTTSRDYDPEVQLALQTQIAKAASRTKRTLNMRVFRARGGNVYYVLFEAGKVRQGLNNLGLEGLNVEEAIKRMATNLELDPLFFTSRSNGDETLKRLSGPARVDEQQQRAEARTRAAEIEKRLSNLARSLRQGRTIEQALGPLDVTDQQANDSLKGIGAVLPAVGNLLNRQVQSHVTRAVRFARNYVATGVQTALASENTGLQTVANILSGFGQNLVRSKEFTRAKDELLVGTSNQFRELSFQLDRTLRALVGNSPERLLRVHMAMDPKQYLAMLSPEGELMRAPWENLMATIGGPDWEALTQESRELLFQEWRGSMKLVSQFGVSQATIPLSPDEQALVEALRLVNDWTHETSFGFFGLPADVYEANKDKYLARMYLQSQEQNEANRAFNGTYGQIFSGMYSGRKDVTAAMQMSAIKDPVYLTMQRLKQVGHNLAVQRYTNFVEKSIPEFISETPRYGYTKLGDGTKFSNFGVLTGKYVVNEVARDLKAMTFSNEVAQKAFETLQALNTPDDTPKTALGNFSYANLKRLFVKSFTSFNPATTLTNWFANQTAAMMAGVDPVTLLTYAARFGNDRLDYSKNFERAVQLRVVGSRRTQADMLAMATTVRTPEKAIKGLQSGELDFEGWELVKDAIDRYRDTGDASALWQVAKTAPLEFYSDIDEAAKYGAWRALMDQGYSEKEAAQVVRETFLQFDEVGRYWAMASITPLLSPFSKVAPELLRQTTNLLTLYPLSSAALLGSLVGISAIASAAAGEDEEDRKLREQRSGAAFYPLSVLTLGALPNVPLNIKLPYTGGREINIARFAVPFYLIARDNAGSVAEQATQMLYKSFPAPGLLYGFHNLAAIAAPGIEKVVPTYGVAPNEYFSSPEGAAAVNQASFVADPVLQVVNLMFLDTDYFGRSITDPESNRYDPSMRASPKERTLNSLYFLARSYVPYGAYIDDLVSAFRGTKDQFGREKQVVDVLLRFTTGAKLQLFNDEQYNNVVVQQLSRSLQKLDRADQALRNEVKRAVEKGEAYMDRSNNVVFYLMEPRERFYARIAQQVDAMADAVNELNYIRGHVLRREKSLMAFEQAQSRLQALKGPMATYGQYGNVDFEKLKEELKAEIDRPLTKGGLKLNRD